MAEKGKTIKELLSLCETISSNIATMGVCLSACSLPGSPPLFSVPDDSLELGVGVHGEAGTARIKVLCFDCINSIKLERNGVYLV